MLELKYAPIKSVRKQLPDVLFYKATGCKKAKCPKCAEGLYNTIDTNTGKFLGSIEVSSEDVSSVYRYGMDSFELEDVLHRFGYLMTGANHKHRKMKLPYTKEYQTIYNIEADEGKNLNSEEQHKFAYWGQSLLRNISDKFKRPIVMQNLNVPASMKIGAIVREDYIAIPYRPYYIGHKGGRLIDGCEMYDRCQYLFSEAKDYGGEYNEQTYKNVDKYLEDNDISGLMYAEYAVHPEPKRPNLKTAIKEFFIDAKNLYNDITESFAGKH